MPTCSDASAVDDTTVTGADDLDADDTTGADVLDAFDAFGFSRDPLPEPEKGLNAARVGCQPEARRAMEGCVRGARAKQNNALPES